MWLDLKTQQALALAVTDAGLGAFREAWVPPAHLPAIPREANLVAQVQADLRYLASLEERGPICDWLDLAAGQADAQGRTALAGKLRAALAAVPRRRPATPTVVGRPGRAAPLLGGLAVVGLALGWWSWPEPGPAPVDVPVRFALPAGTPARAGQVDLVRDGVVLATAAFAADARLEQVVPLPDDEVRLQLAGCDEVVVAFGRGPPWTVEGLGCCDARASGSCAAELFDPADTALLEVLDARGEVLGYALADGTSVRPLGAWTGCEPCSVRPASCDAALAVAATPDERARLAALEPPCRELVALPACFVDLGGDPVDPCEGTTVVPSSDDPRYAQYVGRCATVTVCPR